MEENSMLRVVANEETINRIRNLSTCSSCHMINFKNGHYNSSCHKGIYCKLCLSIAKCNCITMIPENKELANTLMLAKMKCVNYYKGCTELVPYDKIKEHEHSCKLNQAKSSQPSPFNLPLSSPPFIPSKNIGKNLNLLNDYDRYDLSAMSYIPLNEKLNQSVSPFSSSI